MQCSGTRVPAHPNTKWENEINAGRELVQLGAWSYSIYMTHWLVQKLLLRLAKSIGGLSVGDPGSVVSLSNIGHSWTMDFITALYVAMVLALFAVTCKFIEAPGRRYVNQMLRSSSQQRKLKYRSIMRHFVKRN
jgi:peptidoglycan/LPS O-acetylase OafA/YrhL